MATLNNFLTRWWQTDDEAYTPGSNHLTRKSLEMLLDCSNPVSIASWTAVSKLLHRQWWCRAWIVQEATVNRELTWVFCGSQNFGLTVLGGLRDIYFAMAIHDPLPGFDFLAKDIAFFDTLLNMNGFALARRRLPGGRPYLQLASSIRPSNASDPRDKLWSIYGFANDANISVISPATARSLSARQLYISSAVWYLSTHGDLEILGHCTTATDHDLHLPSWVPNWSIRSPRACLSPRADPDVRASAPTYLACGIYKLPMPHDPISSPFPNAVCLQGIKVAIVDRSLAMPLLMPEADYVSGRAWEPYDTSDILSLTGCSMDELLARTLVADCRRIYYSGRWDSERIAATESLWSIQNKAFNPYQWRRTVMGRVLFQTRKISAASESHKVLLGLGPELVQSGDEAWLLKGGNVIYILRPLVADLPKPLQVLNCSGANTDTTATSAIRTHHPPFARSITKSYSLVGEAFIHGLMDGELLGMLGDQPKRARPLPLEGMDRRFCDVLLV